MRFWIFFTVSVLVLTALSSVLPGKADAGIYDSTVRLHVLANSDSEEDQALKLRVRDRVLDTVDSAMRRASDRSGAERELAAVLPEVVREAENELRSAGSDQAVTAELGEEYYPTREYDGVRLPAGVYSSLRIKLGEAAGHNWWCVVFPPLCTGAASPDEELAAVGFTPSQIRLLTDGEGKYVLKFRILEWLAELKASMQASFTPKSF